MVSFCCRAGRSILTITVAMFGACVDQSVPTQPVPGMRPRLAVGDVILVTNADGGAAVGSLRAAVNQATGGEVIRFDPDLAGAKITLDTTLIVPKRVTIEGPADKGITISGGGKVQVLNVREGATLVNVTITEGEANNSNSEDIVGGILSAGPLVLDHSTVSANRGSLAGGIRGDDITLINSTVANNENRSSRLGAGIAYDFTGPLTLVNSTVAGNTGGAGIGPFGFVSGDHNVTLRNSIIANNQFGSCSFPPDGFVYEGKNLSSDDTCGDGVLVMLIADPLLGPLADNGGPTQTLALDRNSGKVAWDKLGHKAVPRVKRHTKASHANSTPATDGRNIVAFFGSEGLFCFDLEGNLVWKKDLGPMDSGYFQVKSAQWGFASFSEKCYSQKLKQGYVNRDSGC